MNLNLSGHHVTITPGIRGHVNSKLERIARHFDHVINVNVILTVEKMRQKAEATVHVRGKEIYVENEDEDLYVAIDKGFCTYQLIFVSLAVQVDADKGTTMLRTDLLNGSRLAITSWTTDVCRVELLGDNDLFQVFVVTERNIVRIDFRHKGFSISKVHSHCFSFRFKLFRGG